jgi:hypothetical protein
MACSIGGARNAQKALETLKAYLSCGTYDDDRQSWFVDIDAQDLSDLKDCIQHLSTENEQLKAQPHYTKTEIYQKGRDDEDKYQFHKMEAFRSEIEQLKAQLGTAIVPEQLSEDIFLDLVGLMDSYYLSNEGQTEIKASIADIIRKHIGQSEVSK